MQLSGRRRPRRLLPLVTVVSIDFLMSTDPHWFSTIYGLYIVGGQAISGMAFVILAALFLA